jgi:hypothetical protein
MSNEADNNPQQEKPQSGGLVNAPDTKTNPSRKIRVMATVHRTSPRRIHRRTATLSTKVKRNQKTRSVELPEHFMGQAANINRPG